MQPLGILAGSDEFLSCKIRSSTVCLGDILMNKTFPSTDSMQRFWTSGHSLRFLACLYKNLAKNIVIT